MDYGQRAAIYNREIDIIEKKRIVNLLDIAEAINLSYVGSQPVPKGKTNKGANQYRKWRNNKYKELNPELPVVTIWDNIKRSGRIN